MVPILARAAVALVAVATLCVPLPARACLCESPDSDPARFASRALTTADLVVYGRVSRLAPDNGAWVTVIEAFKPRKLGREVQVRGDSGRRDLGGGVQSYRSCGIEFKVGETALYTVHQGQMSLCSRVMQPSKRLLDALRAASRR